MEGSAKARIIRVILLAVIGYAFFIFHGLSSHLTPWSQALINAVVKYTYSTAAQDKITVVLFREENLSDLNTHYPVPYRLHAEIIEALASYSPQAVFVDFAFIDNRDPKALTELGDALCALRDSGSQVYIAAPLGKDKLPGVEKQLLACALPAMPEMDGKTAESGVLTYFHGRQAGNGFLPSPGFALAEQEIHVVPKDAEKLEIIWGKGVAPLNRKWMDCAEKSSWELLHDTLLENPLANKLDCPYHRTISANHLLNSVGDDDIKAALTGKTIFYGAGFRFTGDRVESPVYGEMPGVYLHAMAYDNLQTFKQHYKRADRHGIAVKIIDLLLLLLAAWLLVFMPPKEHSETGSLIDFVKNARKTILTALGFAAIMALTMALGGLDVTCLVGAVLYVVFRTLVQNDHAFGILAGITVAASLFCYICLDLGPRNILAFIAFFEIVGHLQEKLIKKAKTYHEFHDQYLTEQIIEEQGSPPPMAAWDRLLGKFFWIFDQPTASSQEHKS